MLERNLRLWWIEMPPDDSRATPVLAVLDERERERRAGFRTEREGLRFGFARGAARLLLGARLGRDPASLTFAYGPAGKPRLVDAGEVRFNVSRSGDLACLALDVDEVGVDLEACDASVDVAAVAERFFAPSERVAIAALPVAQRVRAFYATWTRREAVLKLFGLGLTASPEAFAVNVAPNERPCLLAAAGLPSGAREIVLHSFERGPYALAVATRGATRVTMSTFIPPGT